MISILLNKRRMAAAGARLRQGGALLRNRTVEWAVAGACVSAAAMGGAVLAAREVAHSDARAARTASQRSAARIDLTMARWLQQEEGVADSAAAFLVARQDEAAARQGEAAARQGEAAARQGEAAARQGEAASGTSPRSARPSNTTQPSNAFRTWAAWAQLAQHHPALARLPVVASAPAGLATAKRLSGREIYRSVSVGGVRAVEIDMPVYRTGTPPPTAQQRTAAFVGWVRTTLRPQAILHAALLDQPGFAASLRHRTGSSSAVFASGTFATPSAGAGGPQGAGAGGGQRAAGAVQTVDGRQTTRAAFGSGWAGRIQGPAVSESTLGDGDAVTVLIAGGLASLLLGACVFVLGVGQRRAQLAAVSRRGDGGPGRESLYDPLTGLPNRLLTLDRAEGMLARTGRQSGMLVGALLIDIDWFGDLNDKLGRESGDELLGILAERLRGVVRAHDTVGYLGEDRFIVLVEAQARGARLESLARRVMDAVHKPVDLRGFGPGIHLTTSIGLAFGRYSSTEELLRDAQLALDEAKSAGKNRLTVFNANLRSRMEDTGVLEMELSAALRDGELSLLYQPICELNGGAPVSLEAHVRWTHSERGEVPPEDFMPLAHDTGLIVPIGRWALEQACTRAAAWNVEGNRLGMLVAVSAEQLRRDGFITDVRRALQQSGLDPALLTLAIPEATVIDDFSGTGARMREVKQLGVRIAIDNFGSGYAYRSELRSLPVDIIRVRRGSLAAADDEDYRSWLFEAIVLFARELSLEVIVADVHNPEEMAVLQAIGCLLAEGPLLGEPLTAQAITNLRSTQGSVSAGETGAGAAEEPPASDEPAATVS